MEPVPSCKFEVGIIGGIIHFVKTSDVPLHGFYACFHGPEAFGLTVSVDVAEIGDMHGRMSYRDVEFIFVIFEPQLVFDFARGFVQCVEVLTFYEELVFKILPFFLHGGEVGSSAFYHFTGRRQEEEAVKHGVLSFAVLDIADIRTEKFFVQHGMIVVCENDIADTAEESFGLGLIFHVVYVAVLVELFKPGRRERNCSRSGFCAVCGKLVDEYMGIYLDVEADETGFIGLIKIDAEGFAVFVPGALRSCFSGDVPVYTVL